MDLIKYDVNVDVDEAVILEAIFELSCFKVKMRYEELKYVFNHIYISLTVFKIRFKNNIFRFLGKN